MIFLSDLGATPHVYADTERRARVVKESRPWRKSLRGFAPSADVSLQTNRCPPLTRPLSPRVSILVATVVL
jgi:hypothetical protein